MELNVSTLLELAKPFFPEDTLFKNIFLNYSINFIIIAL